MRSIFSRLYGRGERHGRSQLEDYLTEAFAAVFERLEDDAKRSLLHVLLDPAARTPLDQAMPDLDRVELKTQVRLDVTGQWKCPDMVLRSQKRDFLVIEAKIGAAIARHVDLNGPVTELGPITVSQLETYASWIGKRNAGADGWSGAMILLTAHTPAPLGFPSRRADGVFESVRTWTQVAAWLAGLVRESALDDVARALVVDLLTFLKERRLLDRHFNARDLSALTLYVASEEALRHTFRSVAKAIAERHPSLGLFKHKDVGIDVALGVFWAWIYVSNIAQPRYSQFYVAVGVVTEPGPDFDEDFAARQQEPFFVVFFGDEKLKKVADYVSAVPECWTEMTEKPALLTTRPVREFSSDPDRRADELKAWTCEEVGRLIAVMITRDQSTAE